MNLSDEELDDIRAALLAVDACPVHSAAEERAVKAATEASQADVGEK